jgi:hypothetical protein
VTKEEFFALGWSDSVLHQLTELEGKVKAFSASRTPEGALKVQAWTELPKTWDSHMVYIPAISRTQQALLLIDSGWSAYRACKVVGLSQAAVSRARKRREGRSTCPSCGQLMKS